MISALPIKSTLSYNVFHTNNSALTLKCITCVGKFCAIDKNFKENQNILYINTHNTGIQSEMHNDEVPDLTEQQSYST